MTSHDVVAKVRRELGERRVGHSGTLDPDATGVLLVGVGCVTRALRFLGDLPKTYTGEVVLGVETSTLDAAGEITASHEMSVTLEEVRAAAGALTGEILQVPPMVSAIKVEGRRLHELAREGVEVERAPRPVMVHRFAVESTADPLVYAIEVSCSSGTYVRSLAADLGHSLGGGAHLRGLRRTAIGPFTVASACQLGAVELRPPVDALPHLPLVEVDEGTATLVGHGRPLPVAGFPGSGPWRVVGPAGDLLAIYEPGRPGEAKPAAVLTM